MQNDMSETEQECQYRIDEYQRQNEQMEAELE
jgi:hypothetical protein